ncbi:MAG: pilus assembly protein TadG-related protein [Ruaniaceae bacterium]|nr:pilus assembly protein TadG-related protein [Ruaniaceae bacterium]
MRQPLQRPFGNRDDGAASVLVLAIVAVTLLLAAYLGLLGSASAARHEAQSAADFAALAGAQALLSGAAPCTAAGVVAAANGAEVVACEVSSEHVVVSVRVPVAGMWAHAAARAGPG